MGCGTFELKQGRKSRMTERWEGRASRLADKISAGRPGFGMIGMMGARRWAGLGAKKRRRGVCLSRDLVLGAESVFEY